MDQQDQSGVDTKFLWGEIPRRQPTINLTATEKEALLRIPRPIQLRGPKLHQPGTLAAPKQESNSKVAPKRQESVLMQCARLQEALRNPDDVPGDYLPPKPIKLIRAGPFDTLYSIDDDDVKAKVDPVPPSTLTPATSGQQLRRSTAEILAAVGFTKCSSNAMDVVVDAGTEFFRRLCLRLKEAKEAGSGGGYADCLDRALAEIGMTSVTRLQSYYEDEVLQLQNNLVERVRKMMQEQQQQQQQASSSSGDLPMMYLGASADDNIPEIHFPSSEEGESASSAAAVLSLEHHTPQLDAGMQMLQSLEQGGLTQQQQQQQQGGSAGPSSMTPTAAATAAPSSDVLLNLLAEASPSLQEGGGTAKKKRTS